MKFKIQVHEWMKRKELIIHKQQYTLIDISSTFIWSKMKIFEDTKHILN